MGNKNVVLESGTLYFGKTVLPVDATVIEIDYDDKEFADDQIYLNIPSSQEATFTLEPFPKKDVQLSYEKKET